MIDINKLNSIWGNHPNKPSKLIAQYKDMEYVILDDSKSIFFLYTKVNRHNDKKGLLYVVDSKRCLNGGDKWIIIDRNNTIKPSNYSKIEVDGVPKSIIMQISKLI